MSGNHEHRATGRGVALICGTLIAISLWAAPSAHGQPIAEREDLRRPLSPSERARLDAGLIVVRRTEQQRGPLRLIGGTSMQVVDLPLRASWRALIDIRNYPNMLPAADRARVLEREGTHRTVYVHHRHGPISGGYHLGIDYDPENRSMKFRLDHTRENSIRDAWGFVTLEPYGEGDTRTLITYGVMADIGDGLITGLLRPQVHEWLLKVPFTFKEFVEGEGRARYAEESPVRMKSFEQTHAKAHRPSSDSDGGPSDPGASSNDL